MPICSLIDGLHDRPFFGFVNYFDITRPPPQPPYLGRFSDVSRRPAGEPGVALGATLVSSDGSPRQIQADIDAYDESILYRHRSDIKDRLKKRASWTTPWSFSPAIMGRVSNTASTSTATACIGNRWTSRVAPSCPSLPQVHTALSQWTRTDRGDYHRGRRSAERCCAGRVALRPTGRPPSIAAWRSVQPCRLPGPHPGLARVAHDRFMALHHSQSGRPNFTTSAKIRRSGPISPTRFTWSNSLDGSEPDTIPIHEGLNCTGIATESPRCCFDSRPACSRVLLKRCCSIRQFAARPPVHVSAHFDGWRRSGIWYFAGPAPYCPCAPTLAEAGAGATRILRVCFSRVRRLVADGTGFSQGGSPGPRSRPGVADRPNALGQNWSVRAAVRDCHGYTCSVRDADRCHDLRNTGGAGANGNRTFTQWRGIARTCS